MCVCVCVCVYVCVWFVIFLNKNGLILWIKHSFLINAETNQCNIMAAGFRFMPFGLVRLRTFRLSAWVI